MAYWTASGPGSVGVWVVESRPFFSVGRLAVFHFWFVFIHENTVSIAFHILILATLDGPYQYSHE